MRGLLILIMLSAVAVACEDTDGFSGGAGEALATRIELQSQRDFETIYAAIHPAQRSLIDRADFIRCFERETDLPHVEHVHVLGTFEERVKLPGTHEFVDAVAVSVRVDQSRDGTAIVAEGTFQVVQVDDRWYWVVEDPAVFGGGCAE